MVSRRLLLRVAGALALSGIVATTLVDGGGPTFTLRTAAGEASSGDAPTRAPVDVDSAAVEASPVPSAYQPKTVTPRRSMTEARSSNNPAPTTTAGTAAPGPGSTGPTTSVPVVEDSGVEIAQREGLWVLDVETGTPTFHAWSIYSHARFAPDGESIVSKATWTSIDEYPLDGSAPRRLVSCADHGCDSPEWSSDGSLLRYVDWKGRIHIVDRDGTPRHVVAMPDSEHQAIDSYAFAPDGALAAWSTVEWDRIDELPGGTVEAHVTKMELRISKIDGSEARVVQSGDRFLWIEWSPDGRYVTWRNAFDELFVMDTTDDSVRRVRVPSGPVYEVGWGPDGFFVSGTALWRFTNDGGRGEPALIDDRGAQLHTSKTGEVLWQRRPAGGFATPAAPDAGAVTVGRRDKHGDVSTVAWIGNSWSLEVVHLSADGRYVAFFAIEPWWR